MLRAHRLTDPLLFAAVVVAWGLTWYAIRLQLGPTPPETSIFWRFFLASIAMWAGLAATGRLKRAPWRGQPWLIAFGVVLFSVNFLCFYNAERFTLVQLVGDIVDGIHRPLLCIEPGDEVLDFH